MTVAFALILILLSYFDIKYRIVPNIVTIPLIFIGCYLTGNWLWALGMFGLLSILYWAGIFMGGDVKLMTMLAAFFGDQAYFMFPVSLFLLMIFLAIKKQSVPYTPFVLVSYLVIFGQAGIRMVL